MRCIVCDKTEIPSSVLVCAWCLPTPFELDFEVSNEETGEDEILADIGEHVSKRKKVEVVDGRKRLPNVFQPVVKRLGVVTWNVAHFGEGKLEIQPALKEVCEGTPEFVEAWPVKKLVAAFVDYFDEYDRWRANIRLLIEAHGEGDKAIATAQNKLAAAEKRHRGEARRASSEKDEEDEEDGDNDPDSLAELLATRWKAFDDRHAEGEYFERSELEKLWGEYFDKAYAYHASAWTTFSAEWGLVGESEEDIQGDLTASMAPLAVAVKYLRGGAKMIVKPILQLRERVKLSKKVHAAAEKTAGADEDWKGVDQALAAAADVSNWAVGPLLARVVKLDQVLHRVLVALHVVRMFQHNTWLDVMVLHEVNKGVGELGDFLAKKGYTLVPGFKLESKSGKGSQTEYYPIVFRENGCVKKVDSVWAMYNDGGCVDHNYDGEPWALQWKKSDDIYRPILGYDLRVARTERSDPHLVRIGVVHTSPGGSEMERSFVYGQVDEPLAAIAQSSIPTVVGGDFYLTAEAVTRPWKELDTGAKKKVMTIQAAARVELRKRLEAVAKEIERAKTKPNPKKRKHSSSSEEEEIDADDALMEKLLERQRRISSVLETLGSDKIQVIRNDDELCISVEKRIASLGLEIAQPLAGTNWKTKAIDQWFDAQIADFFVHTGPKSAEKTSRWMMSRVGLVSPTYGLRLFDETTLDVARYWRFISDHMPVGIVLSANANDGWLDLPFSDLAQQLTRNTTKQSPEALLGIANPGNACYVNAALQLLARIDLRARYLVDHGAFGEDSKPVREETAGVLTIREEQGQNGTYGVSGKYGRYTTAVTLGLRSELSSRGLAVSAYAQADAGEALGKILEAFDHAVGGFNPGSQTDLAFAREQDDFTEKRPSKLHFLLAVKTTYVLGEASESSAEVMRVDPISETEAVATRYRCDNVLRILLPDEIGPEEKGEKVSKTKEKPPTKVGRMLPEPEPEPLKLDALIGRTVNLNHGDEGAETAVRIGEKHYPRARSKTEMIDIVKFPEHWLVMLERFGRRGKKKRQKVDVPMNLYEKTLAGFIVHIGERATSGHYVAYIEHMGAWFLLDDEQVIPVEDVSGPLKDAYVLYYQ